MTRARGHPGVSRTERVFGRWPDRRSSPIGERGCPRGCELLTLSKRDFKRCLSENFEMTMTVMRGRPNGCEKPIKDRQPRPDGRVRQVGTCCWTGGNVDGRKVSPETRQTGHRQDDRRLSRDGSPVMKDLQSGGYNRGASGSISCTRHLTIDEEAGPRRGGPTASERLEINQSSLKRNQAPTRQGRRAAAESRLFVLAAAALYLSLVLTTFNRADPGWSHSVAAGEIRNLGAGRVPGWPICCCLVRRFGLGGGSCSSRSPDLDPAAFGWRLESDRRSSFRRTRGFACCCRIERSRSLASSFTERSRFLAPGGLVGDVRREGAAIGLRLHGRTLILLRFARRLCLCSPAFLRRGKN